MRTASYFARYFAARICYDCLRSAIRNQRQSKRLATREVTVIPQQCSHASNGGLILMLLVAVAALIIWCPR
ncbi:MAG TPA: hypothetical protein VNX26_02305 [Candidatus Acidoferrum sp.]|jgi:hypothetical protein|nr:hypothetical protein [Candidatus Acidoferrum sp.]